MDDSKKYAVLEVYKAKVAHDRDRAKAATILKIVADDKIDDHMIRNESFKIIEKDKLNKFANNLAKPKFEELPYVIEYYYKNYHAIRLNLRSTFQSINFTYEKDTPIKAAIIFFKHFLNNNTPRLDNQAIDTIPTDFIPNRMKRFVINKKTQAIDKKGGKKVKKVKYVNGKLYEIILYIEAKKAIGSKIFISESESYRSLEEELISPEVWNRDKETILSSLTNRVVSLSFEEILGPMEAMLEKLYTAVNARIQNGTNKHIKVDAKNNTWKLPYEKQNEEVNNHIYHPQPKVSTIILPIVNSNSKTLRKQENVKT
jgi:hypothetical protein